MRTMLVLVFAVVSATPARAAMVTWFDSGALTFVHPEHGPILFPGLTVGTPWTLQINFDPAAPGDLLDPGGRCYVYPIGPTTFTLGGFTYASSASGGGLGIYTNADLPGQGCTGTPTGGEVVFQMGGWTQEPGAWDLRGLLIAGYTDAIRRDGTLPSVPNLSGINTGLNFYNFFINQAPLLMFDDRTFAPTALTPVPEPGTFAMLGIGLAYVARRRLRHGVRAVSATSTNEREPKGWPQG